MKNGNRSSVVHVLQYNMFMNGTDRCLTDSSRRGGPGTFLSLPFFIHLPLSSYTSYLSSYTFCFKPNNSRNTSYTITVKMTDTRRTIRTHAPGPQILRAANTNTDYKIILQKCQKDSKIQVKVKHCMYDR